MITQSPRSESWQEKRSAVEWLSISIVHDLRNPIGAIYAAAEMLMDVDAGPAQVTLRRTHRLELPGAGAQAVEALPDGLVRSP